MISKIAIKNFKSLENVNIECSNLNILTGINGMGKSSVIQALLLLRQSYDRGFLKSEGLSLNGDLVNIGTGKDALYEFAYPEEISFSLEFDENSKVNTNTWNFAYEVNSIDAVEDENKYSGSDFLPFSEDADNKSIIEENLEDHAFFKRNTFKYLNADRWVKNEYEISDFHVIRNKNLGKHGEYTVHFLNHYGSKPINPELLFDGVETNELLIQVSAWLSEISPGTRVIADRISGANSVKLRYVFNDNGVSSRETTPMNVGFGITYVLPVLVALLSAKSGDILIIENPESHIHPKGQSIIGNLMTKVAQLGVQIFVETHSDHVLNGVRVGVKQGFPNNMVKVSYFYRGNTKGKINSAFLNPEIDKDGGINLWPEGFFDQATKDLNFLFDI